MTPQRAKGANAWQVSRLSEADTLADIDREVADVMLMA
jgi:hypothetical protein